MLARSTRLINITEVCIDRDGFYIFISYKINVPRAVIRRRDSRGNFKTCIKIKILLSFLINESNERIIEYCKNWWGYQLLEHDKKNEALQVFKLNTTLFSNSWNVYDSYGEILATLGYREKAIINYKKSLEPNPDNSNARNYLKGKN